MGFKEGVEGGALRRGEFGEGGVATTKTERAHGPCCHGW